VLKEQNKKFNNEITNLRNRINILEQKALANFIEVVGVPEIQDEICTDTANLILNKLGFVKGISCSIKSRKGTKEVSS